jgi:hypothetical protein
VQFGQHQRGNDIVAGQIDEQRQRLPFGLCQPDAVYQFACLCGKRLRRIKLGFDFDDPLDALTAELLKGGGLGSGEQVGEIDD